MKSLYRLPILLLLIAVAFTACQSLRGDTASQGGAVEAATEAEAGEGEHLTRRPAGDWDFANFMADIEPNTTVYSINPRQDQYLEGPGGTRIFIPRNSLRTERFAPPKGEVQVTLKEYYSPSDFVRGGLSTTSDGQLLTTRGTVDLRVTSQGEDLRVAPGQSIGLFMPTNESVSGNMSWFFGQARANGDINWEEQAQSLDFYVRTLTTVNLEPKRLITDYDGVALDYRFAEGGTLHDYLESHPPLADDILLENRKMFYDVVFKFRLDEDGKVRNVRQEGSSGQQVLDQRLRQYVSNLPPFEAATAENPTDPNRMLAVGFHLDVITKEDTIKPEEFQASQMVASNQITEHNFYSFPMPRIMDWADDPSYTTFGINQFGLINCDRFNSGGPRTSLFVALDQEVEDERIQFFLPAQSGWILGSKGVRDGKPVAECFSIIPVGTPVTVIALRVRNGHPEFAVNHLTAQRNQPQIQLKYEDFDPQKMQAAINSI